MPAPRGSRRTDLHKGRASASRSRTLLRLSARSVQDTMRLGIADTFAEQPGVQLVVSLEPQPWREEAFADESDLVLDLTLLPARCGRAGDRFDDVVAAHLQKAAAIVEPVLAYEDRLHRRLHVVVD